MWMNFSTSVLCMSTTYYSVSIKCSSEWILAPVFSLHEHNLLLCQYQMQQILFVITLKILINRLIVVAEKQTVYDKFPIPLINRLEKHFLTVNNLLNEEQLKLAEELTAWVKKTANAGYFNILMFGTHCLLIWEMPPHLLATDLSWIYSPAAI